MTKFTTVQITIPPKLHICILKLNNRYNCIIYSSFFVCKLNLSIEQSINFNEQTHTLNIKANNNSQFLYLYKKYTELLLYVWNFFFCAKFKLKGKGFRIYRRRENKFVKFFFGHSHFKIIKFKGCILLKPHKYKFLVYSNSQNKINNIIRMVKTIRPIDLFTKRGLRYSRQIIMKRKGKSLIF